MMSPFFSTIVIFRNWPFFFVFPPPPHFCLEVRKKDPWVQKGTGTPTNVQLTAGRPEAEVC